MKLIKYLILALSFTFIFNGCSSKQGENFNKPALFWYNKMLQEISLYQLDEADETFTSLESEHRKSPLLPSALILLANAHMNDEAYEMASFYFNEYLKKFDDGSLNEYVRYLTIKAKFLAFKDQFREQKLIEEALLEIEQYKRQFPNSTYSYLIDTIESRLLMAQSTLDLEIASLYQRIDKPKAAKIYQEKAKQSWLETNIIEPVHVPWYRAIFE